MADAPRKLLVKAGDRVLVAGDAVDDAAMVLGALPDGSALVDSGAADIAVFFVVDRAALGAVQDAVVERAHRSRAVWIAYPKKSSAAARDLDRDGLRAALEAETNITTVTQIALDETWSAIRVRPVDEVGR